jgi:hypothetical protein
VFRKMIRDIAAEDGLPDYRLEVTDDDLVLVRPRPGALGVAAEAPRLDAEVHDRVRALAPGLDPYGLEADWRRFWAASGRPRLRSPEAAFLAFVRARAARQ